MSGTTEITGKNASGNVWLRGFLLCSLTLNAGLAVWLLRETNQIPNSNASHFSNQLPSSDPHGKVELDHVANVAAGLIRWNWREVESADYCQYVSNLRSVGCPEQIVRDIIAADLNQLYATRADAIRGASSLRQFWQKPLP